MSEKPTIKPTKNGPYQVTGCAVLKNYADGASFDATGTVALCRCGGSKSKPFCDGTHGTNGFTDEKSPDRVPDKRETYAGAEVTVYDNRGICAHAGRCTDGLPSVFRLREEPFVNPDGAPGEAIIAQVTQCPSGALSYAVDGVEHRDREGDPMILIAPNGPYVIVGGADLQDAEFGEGASHEHFDLCRCGQSKNKPFCSGAHWYVQFDEHAPKQTE
jgi:CDGSH-type Zn-finger protein